MITITGFILKFLSFFGLTQKIDRQETRHQQIIEFLERLKVSKDIPILDVGCGNGNLLISLRNAGYTNLSGCDIDADKVYSDEFKYFKIDLNDKDLKFNKKYKLVLCSQVIEHLFNVKNALEVIYQLVDKKGYALISYPNCESIFMRASFLFGGKLPRYNPKSGGKYNGHINIIPENIFRYFIFNLFSVIIRLPNISIWKRYWIKFLPSSKSFQFQTIFFLRKL